MPGLIPGAAQGKGLGLEFLRHVERCAVLLHVVDCATDEPGRDPLSDIDAIEHELAQYSSSLAGRPRLVALNKMDVPSARDMAELVRAGARGPRAGRSSTISAATREGLTDLSYALAAEVSPHRASLPPPEPTRIVLRPAAVDDGGFTVGRGTRTIPPRSWSAGRGRSGGCGRPTSATTRRSATWPTGWPGSGSRTRWSRREPWPGSGVTIGEVTFDWEPTLGAAAQVGSGPRGTDMRVETNARRGAAERLETYRARHTPAADSLGAAAPAEPAVPAEASAPAEAAVPSEPAVPAVPAGAAVPAVPAEARHRRPGRGGPRR